MGFSKSSARGRLIVNELSQETREKSNNLTLHLKELEKEKGRTPGLVEGKKS